MKNNAILFIILLGLSFSTVSCTDEWFGVSGSGQIVSQERDVSGFKNLELDMAAHVEISSDSVFSIEVSDYENLVSHISTELKGETLVIRHDPKNINVRNSEAMVKISMPSLLMMEINGSGDVSVLSGFHDIKSINISGSGEVTASEPFDTENLSIDISGSGKVTVAGLAGKLNIDISGSGNFYGYNLEVKEADCNISGSGNAYINVVQYLQATISGSGNITYIGNPLISAKISGSGKIRNQ